MLDAKARRAFRAAEILRRMSSPRQPSVVMSSTAISPSVSRPRKSTSVVLTAFAPAASGLVCSSTRAPTRAAGSSRVNTSTSANISAPTPSASTTFKTRRGALSGGDSSPASAERGKRLKSSSTRISVTVSTSSCVSARSGAR
jgi:hypothetical protein